MNAKAQNALDLKLFADSCNVVWFGTSKEQGKAHVSELSIADFLKNGWVQTAERIRLLGCPSNARLICALYEDRLTDPTRSSPIIQIGTPTAIPADARNDPPRIITAMDELRLPSSCGGWHELTEHDYAAYSLAVHSQGQTSSTAIMELLERHPAYPAVSFIPTFSPLDAAKLLSEILDPRWFVDPIKPDRTSRLRNYLGMRIDIIEKMFTETAPNARQARAHLVFKSWAAGEHAEDAAEDAPGSFLMRVIRDAQTRDKGLLKACIRYISFIRGVWLDQIANKGRTLFVPEYFFANKEEAEAYQLYVRSLNRDRKRNRS